MSPRFKLDENLPRDAVTPFRERGMDARTVADQDAQGRSDGNLLTMCTEHDEVLVTLDMDFANIITYPPTTHCGIVVMRLERQDRQHVLNVIRRALPELEREEIAGNLIIVEASRIRVFPVD